VIDEPADELVITIDIQEDALPDMGETPAVDPFANFQIDDSALEESNSSSFELNLDDALSGLDAELASLGEELGGMTIEAPEVPAIEATVIDTKPAATLPRMPLATDLDAKSFKKLVTYNVNGVAVPFLQENAYIKNITQSGEIKSKAMEYNNIMKQMNAKQGFSEEQQSFGRFYTQMIREYALEIAAANGVTEPVKGDSGCAVLVAEVARGHKKQPALTFRNDAERAEVANVYRDMVKNPANVAGYEDIVKSYAASLPLSIDAFVGDKDATVEERRMTGIALLYVRLTSTWNRTATKGKRIANAFPEVKKENA
jgi:hypothetical protein